MAQKFSSEINLIKDGNPFNAKSIMSMGLSFGDEVSVSAVGTDADQAETEIAELIKGLAE